MAARLSPGRRIAPLRLETIQGAPVTTPDPHRLVHLQFRRFAGCPVCNLHLRSFVNQSKALEDAGVREVVFFHTSADELRRHAHDLPFAVVADPAKRQYAAFGVEAGVRAMLDPRAWGPILHAIAAGLVALVREGRPAPSLTPEGGRYGLPADFLVAPDGRILACKYGDHVYDQWSVAEVLALAAQHRGVMTPPRATAGA